MTKLGVSWRITALLTVCAVLAGCSATPETGLPSADSVVDALTRGLQNRQLDQVPFVGGTEAAQGELTKIMARMTGAKETVTAEGVEYKDAEKRATAKLKHTYALGDEWSYETTAQLRLTDDKWQVEWEPTIVHPDLSSSTRLRLTRTAPPRAPINGSDGLALVEQQPVVRVGLDKANLAKDKWDSSARQLAGILTIDVEGYAKKVADSGEKAFVVARTVRQGQLPPTVSGVPGVFLQDAQANLGPSDTFANGLLGVTGEATAEIVNQSEGAVQAGDIVGLTGLQQRHDKQLRGEMGYRVDLVTRPAETPASASPPPAPTPDRSQDKNLFEKKPKQGQPLELTLNADLQDKAEAALSGQSVVAGLVAIKPSTGEILAAANSPAAGANPFATTGRYPPGSTFKVVTSLALLRKGLNPASSVECTETYTVSGRSFPNYDNYPSSGLGSVPLARAFAQSCNTAFMKAGEQLSVGELAEAAGSLGLGLDYDPGFSSFYGSVPQVDNAIAKAAGMIGQGQVEASPLAMAGVVASVASGRTVVPWMIRGTQPTPTGKPLEAGEAETLRTLMNGVVDGGTASALKGIVDGAKTGTAQFGASAPFKKHAWMIAWKDDLAVAVFVYDGESGSATAGPLVKTFFS